MKIAISAVGIDPRAGTGRHVSQLLRHLAYVDSTNEYVVFMSLGQMDDLEDIQSARNFRWRIVPLKFHGAISGLLWNYTVLYRELRQQRIDLVHFPEINRCLVPRYFPIVVTAHGLIAFRVKNKDGKARGFYHKRIIPLALRRAEHIIAVSENTKRDVVELVGIPEHRISVIPNGCTVWPKEDISLHDSDNPKLKFIQKPYVLSVSRLEHPNKNHVRLLNAFKQLLMSSQTSLQLVLVGEKGWRFEKIRQAIDELKLNEHVNLTGYVNDFELKALYRGARALVMPSLYEGFGIPVIEAMSLGVPVACSNTSSLKDIAKDAALFFDPFSADDIAKALGAVMCDDGNREALIARGFKRAEAFTWPSIARKTLETYESIHADFRKS